MTNVNDLLRDHVTLTVECLDRLYLNGYIPTLQVPGQLVSFLIGHRGNPLPSPALLERVPETHRYQLTPYGRKVALFFTRLHARVFRQGFAALDPTVPMPSPLAEA